MALLAGAGTALTACVSFGTVAFSGVPSVVGADGSRIGVLPLDVLHLALAGAAAALVIAAGWRAPDARRVVVATAPLALLLLPWLPFPVPAVFLVWTGALASLVWIGVGISVGGLLLERRANLPRLPASPLLAGALATAIFSLAAWGVSPLLPGGDEPHYLVITQSLLRDGDLNIENNHARGDYRAYFLGDLPPHAVRRGRNGALYSIHSPGVPALVLPAFAVAGYHGVVAFLILVSSAGCALAWWLAWRTTGSAAAAWFGWAAVTTSAPFLLESFTVFPDGPGAVVVLTGFWALLRGGWDRRAAAEHGTNGAAEYAEHGEHGRTGAAEHAEYVEHSRDGAAGHAEYAEHGRDGAGEHVSNTAAVHAQHAKPGRTAGARVWFLHGLALALLPWMHTRFAVLAGTLGGLILVRIARTPDPVAKAAAFLTAPAASALGWLFYFVVLYGTPDPSAPYGREAQNALAFFPDGAGGLLFDQGFGLFATAPVLIVAAAGFTRTRRLALEWLVVLAPYLLAVATFAMWWAGLSGPSRFLVPLVLPLAVPAACAWAAASSSGRRVLMMAALVVSAWLSLVMAGAGDGRLAYHTRNEAGATAAPWLEWANHVVDLPAAFPAFVPQPVQPDPGGLVSRSAAARTGFATTLPWVIVLGLGSLFVLWRVRGGDGSVVREGAVTTVMLAFAAALTIGISTVWRTHGVDPITAIPAQLDVLRRVSDGGVTAVGISPPRLLPIDDAWAMRMQVPVPRRRGPRAANRPLAVYPAVPAGSYVVSVQRHGGADGWIMLGIGNDQFAIATEPIAAYDAGVRVDLPVTVRALLVRADEGAREQLDAIELRPVARPGAGVAGDFAQRAVRYPAAVVFFLDDRAYPEPSGFWVGGSREARIVVRPEAPRSCALALRNGASANVVTLRSGKWREEITLDPGEERRVDVPLDASIRAAAVAIRSSSGFRPSAVDPASRDARFLGVFVRVVEP